MRFTLLAASGLALTLVSCVSSPIERRNHWTPDATRPSLAYNFLGYPGPDTGRYESYRDFQWQEKQAINLTLRRHFLNRNPENPFQPFDPNYGRERPPHSPGDDAIGYFHLSSLATGFAVLLASGGTAFVPIPLDSLFGTFEEGGRDEFVEGFERRPAAVSPHTRHVPPTPEEFQVRNVDPPRRTFDTL